MYRFLSIIVNTFKNQKLITEKYHRENYFFGYVYYTAEIIPPITLNENVCLVRVLYTG